MALNTVKGLLTSLAIILAMVVFPTPGGPHKIIDGIFPPTYQPKYVEAAWQSWWEKSKFYSPNRDDALNRPYEEKFIMVIPPPNVTGYTCIYCYSYSFLL